MVEQTQPTTAAQAPGFYRFKIGEFDVIALHDGVISFDRPPGFVTNASDAEVGEAFAVTGTPRDKVALTFTALAIDTGKGVVLIDTGLGAGGPPGTGSITKNLQAAGIEPEAVDTVIISHFHSDHFGGLRRADGSLAFPDAEIAVPEKEWAFWMSGGAFPDAAKGNAETCQKLFGPLAKEVRRFNWGDEVLPGFTAIDVHGHTPGMAALQIASGSDTMMFVADITNNPLIFARHPEWQLMFDMDPLAAVATRKKILDQAAADKLRLSFFHAPFPATGYVVKSGAGYEFLPALWMAP